MTPFPRQAYRSLSPYAPDRRPAIVDLSDNTSRWGCHPDALRAVREASPDALVRYPPVYADRLKAAVATRFAVTEAEVTTGCGSDDLLDSAFRAAGEPGEGVRFIPPTFSMVETFARMNGLEPMAVDRPGAPDAEHPFGPLPHPERLLDGRPALVYVCRPNNPTGEVQARGWIEALIAAAGATGPVILLDEAYADFAEDPGHDEAWKPWETDGPARVAVLRTLSKVHGLAGLRIGFALGTPEVIREIEKSRGPYKVSRLAEAAAVAALEDRSGWVAQVVASVREERQRLVEELTARGLPPLPSGANFLCVPLSGTRPRANGTGAPETPSRTLTSSPSTAIERTATELNAAELTAALRERGVAVRPFPETHGIGEAIRVSIGPREEMDRFLLALDETFR